MDRPNFLIIMSDEHNPAYSSVYGHPTVQTPNLDRLAAEGSTFENAYCNSPLCVPSRASFMSGRYVHEVEVWDNANTLRTDQITWAHRLNSLGYDTALCGKMHFVGPDQMHGFKHRLLEDIHGGGTTTGRLPDWSTGGHFGETIDNARRLTEVPRSGDYFHLRYDDEVTARTVEFLSQPDRRERPFAICASIFTPHFPFIARDQHYFKYYADNVEMPRLGAGDLGELHPQNERLLDVFQSRDIPPEQVRKARAAYYGMCTFADEKIGQMVDALDYLGLGENTVVIYVADHGEQLGEKGLWYKCGFYDASTKIPFLVRWPGVTSPGSRFKRVTSLLDVVKTVLEGAGADSELCHGTSLLPLLSGAEPDGGGEAICDYYAHGSIAPGRSIRQGRHKLNYYHGERPELFDLEDDPEEVSDLAGDPAHAETVQRLTAAALKDWDPEEIARRVIHSQQSRSKLVGAVGDQAWGQPYQGGDFA